MVRSVRLLGASLLVLSPREAAGLTSTRLGCRPSLVPPRESAGLPTEFVAKKKRRSKATRLTSTYVEARHVPNRPFRGLLSFARKHGPLKWASLLKRKRFLAALLAAIILFAPSFSPANAATAAVEAVGGVAPVAPLSDPSRALGSFNFLPSKAERELCFRLLYSACSGAFVGLERGSSSDRPAGVRTMALVGLGACTYTICSTHGFLPHAALGCAPDSPILANVKVDISRVAANIASGVGFIGAGAIHKTKLHGNGTEAQNVIAGLTTAAAIWISAAVGIASAVGLYFVGAVATFTTVGILKYARIQKEEEPGFSWTPRPLEVVDTDEVKPASRTRPETAPQEVSTRARRDDVSGLFGKNAVSGYEPRRDSYIDQQVIETYPKDPPIIIKEVLHPHFEQYLQSLVTHDKGILGDKDKTKVLIEEEQEVISYNITDSEHDSSFEP